MESHDSAARHIAEAIQWVRTTVADVLDRDVADVDGRPALVAGHYRRRRRWSCVVDVDGRRLAAVHVVALSAKQLGEGRLLSITDEMLGRALDASKATTGDELRSWLGYILLIEDDPFWHESTTITNDAEATRIDRLSFFVDRILASNLLDAAVVTLVDPTTGRRTATRPSWSPWPMARSTGTRSCATSPR